MWMAYKQLRCNAFKGGEFFVVFSPLCHAEDPLFNISVRFFDFSECTMIGMSLAST